MLAIGRLSNPVTHAFIEAWHWVGLHAAGRYRIYAPMAEGSHGLW